MIPAKTQGFFNTYCVLFVRHLQDIVSKMLKGIYGFAHKSLYVSTIKSILFLNCKRLFLVCAYLVKFFKNSVV